MDKKELLEFVKDHCDDDIYNFLATLPEHVEENVEVDIHPENESLDITVNYNKENK